MGSHTGLLLIVAAGGALGGMARLALSDLLAQRAGTGFPWGTLVVNLSGALLAGGLAGWFGLPADAGLSGGWALLVVGLLGSYTTVSSLSLQSLALWQSGRWRAALANVSATLIAGLALAALGWRLVEGLA
ncbi:camphor resistance protein CrcB [Halomonas sp. MCCC 1A17488]|uniref:Fluoride-specific ion channel FluC n=1 Tax=Billgrantia sulfidoxydans TaxID=2733484 RepID=A0ABX7W9W9_9GAMM|nr:MULTISPECIES: CrcB family protein [Halomonas]MCE8017449.1 camphor resistance protein CrcB [Halomonas sp. MCCC 1A17488]MCG3240782.1 camphor resistance protein CrcB [Halomonas sp. MCCC 1A17488]QPP49382.1 CrcB family protein [Halomonas sp. SS10-MC5]QTP56741.1 camphor resistance protein CrcB [Halomonas sulfidoxydans]